MELHVVPGRMPTCEIGDSEFQPPLQAKVVPVYWHVSASVPYEICDDAQRWGSDGVPAL
jgi:hypothetical protein